MSSPTTPDLDEYRHAVADLLDDLRHQSGSPARAAVDRLDEPRLAAVLDAVPGGLGRIRQELADEAATFRPDSPSSATDHHAFVRIFLLSQIDTLWWAHAPELRTDEDVAASDELVDLEPLRRAGRLGFEYRRQPDTFVGRARDGVRRRVAPHRSPHTAGVRFTRVRPELAALVNEVATTFAVEAPDAPRLWVTSMTRSVEHQLHLRTLGYSALLPSAHCNGYAVDVEMAWFGRFGAAGALATVLLELQQRGLVNVIDEGQAWHVCLSPGACGPLRAEFERTMEV